MPEQTPRFRRSNLWTNISIPQKIILDLPNDVKWVPDCDIDILGRTIRVPLIHRPLLLGIFFGDNHHNRQNKHLLEECGWCIEIVDERDVVHWEYDSKRRHIQFAFSNPVKCYERRAAIQDIDKEME